MEGFANKTRGLYLLVVQKHYSHCCAIGFYFFAGLSKYEVRGSHSLQGDTLSLMLVCIYNACQALEKVFLPVCTYKNNTSVVGALGFDFFSVLSRHKVRQCLPPQGYIFPSTLLCMHNARQADGRIVNKTRGLQLLVAQKHYSHCCAIGFYFFAGLSR